MADFKSTQITDSWGDSIGSTMIDQIMIADSNRLSGGVFNGSTVDTNFYTNAITANATGAITGGTIALTTTTDSGSAITTYANSLARYRGASQNASRHIARFSDTGKTNNIRRLGVYNGATFTDGFYFQLNASTFQIGHMTGSSETLISSGSFNGAVTTWVADANYHTFEIIYTNKRIEFYIDKVLIHTLTQTSARIANTRHFKPFIQNINAGVGSVCSLYCDTITISRYGSAISQAKTYYRDTTTAGVLLKAGPGALHLMNLGVITATANVTLYDGTSTGGRVIYSTGAMDVKAQPFTVEFDGGGGTPFDDGLFLVVGGANANVFIKYE